MLENKPIIIDEVDVSKCQEVANYENVLIVCHVTGKKCELNNNCLFKQLTRKTQECEELKSVLDSWMSKCERETRIKELYQDGLDQLKAAKEQAEQKLEKIREYCNKYPQNSIGFKKNILQIIDEVEWCVD